MTVDTSSIRCSDVSRSQYSPSSPQRAILRRPSTSAHDAYPRGLSEGSGHRLLAQRGAGRRIFKAVSLSNLREIRNHHKVRDGSPHRFLPHKRLSVDSPASRSQTPIPQQLNQPLPSIAQPSSVYSPYPLSPTAPYTVHKPSGLRQTSADYNNGVPPLPSSSPSSPIAPLSSTEPSNGKQLSCSHLPGSTRAVLPLVLPGSPNLSPARDQNLHNQRLRDKVLP